jgi:hypothetical protein
MEGSFPDSHRPGWIYFYARLRVAPRPGMSMPMDLIVNLRHIVGHGERQELSRPRVLAPLSFMTKEGSVFLLGMPRTTKGTATGCGTL